MSKKLFMALVAFSFVLMACSTKPEEKTPAPTPPSDLNTNLSSDNSSIPVQPDTTPSATSQPTFVASAPSSINQSSASLIYSDAGFFPNVLVISTGTTVTFSNSSARGFWPASGDHPTHTVYPTTGGCVGSTFDACQEIAPGQAWSFKFDTVGSWNYHDHLNPNFVGTVVVQ